MARSRQPAYSQSGGSARKSHPARRPNPSVSERSFKIPQFIQDWSRTIGGLIGIVIAVGILVVLIWYVFKSNVHQLIPLKRSHTIVLVDPQPGNQANIIVVQLAANSKKVILYTVPSQLTSQLFSSYGEYQLSSIYPLLKLERKGSHYIEATLGAVLGVVVDAVVPIDHLAERASFSELEKNPQGTLLRMLRPLCCQQKEDIGWRTQWQWLTYLERADLTWLTVEGEDTMPSFQFETTYGDLKDCSVAVINTTRVKGLARRISNELENSGLTVIRTAAEQSTEAMSVVLFDEQYPKCRSLIPYIQQALPNYREAQMDQNLVNRFRANLVVVLGADLITPSTNQE